MHIRFTGALLVLLLSLPSHADDRISAEQIRKLIATTDAASMNRDTVGIGVHLGESFEKVIEFPYKDWMAKVKLNKQEYLDLIDAGWANIQEYNYERANTEIHIMPDGLSGMSYSTITEHLVLNGERMTSLFREYATYALEDGRPVITRITGHTLVGDTTPQ